MTNDKARPAPPLPPWFAGMSAEEVARIKELSRQEERRMGRLLRQAAKSGRF